METKIVGDYTYKLEDVDGGLEIRVFYKRRKYRIAQGGILLWGNSLVHPSAHISNVNTDKHHQRKGIATQVMLYLIDWAKQKGCKQITLTATTQGFEVYSKLGFISPSNDNWGHMVLRLKNGE